MRVAGAQQYVGGNRESYYFRAMDIDPTALSVTLRDGIPGAKRPTGEFFAPFVGGVVHSISHYDNNQRYSDFTIDPDGVLISREKFQELARGPFGTVYAKTAYYYSERGAHAILFSVRAYANAAAHEVPEVVTAMPTDRDLSLDAVSVIRVFVAGSGFIVAVGQYSPDGQLVDVVIDGARSGDWIHNNKIDELDPSLEASIFRSDDYMRFRKIFGFPESIPAPAMLNDANLWASGDRTPLLTLVNLHYARNRWIKQTPITASGTSETRMLTYRITAQDRALENIEGQLIFRPAISRR